MIIRTVALNLSAVYSLTYQVMDLFYQHFEIDNLHVEMIGDRLVVLHMKNTIFRGDSEELDARLHKATFSTAESIKQSVMNNESEEKEVTCRKYPGI